MDEKLDAFMKPLPTNLIASVNDTDSATMDAWRELGLSAISRNEVACVLLAGGQGTRLGSTNPKGTLPCA